MSTAKLKIGIVTLPFNTNYGGLLQAFALQRVLINMGHNVLTVNRATEGMPLKMKILSFGRRIVLRTIFRKQVVVRTWPSKNEQKTIAQHTDRFLKESIVTTELLKSEKDFNKLKKYGFDAYVVGSDQVWRPKYSPNLKNHFLGFLNGNAQIKRISYAASFGVDMWEYTTAQTDNCIALARQFKSISVREDSAVTLCRQHLGVNAAQHIDPTLLVSKEEYIKLVEKDKIQKNEGKLLVYVLDLSTVKQKIIKQVKNELQLEITSTMPESSFKEAGSKNLEKCIFPPVTNWIRGFMDAEFVITDSFHGTVFAIIFNKPFISVGNKKRGMTRFHSLLAIFGLENRLIGESEMDIKEIINTPIDFENVNKIIEKKKKEALQYLEDALKTA